MAPGVAERAAGAGPLGRRKRDGRGAGDGGQARCVDGRVASLRGARGPARVAGGDALGVTERAAGAGPLVRRDCRGGRGRGHGGRGEGEGGEGSREGQGFGGLEAAAEESGMKPWQRGTEEESAHSEFEI
jgi:hypothetical protein